MAPENPEIPTRRGPWVFWSLALTGTSWVFVILQLAMRPTSRLLTYILMPPCILCSTLALILGGRVLLSKSHGLAKVLSFLSVLLCSPLMCCGSGLLVLIYCSPETDDPELGSDVLLGEAAKSRILKWSEHPGRVPAIGAGIPASATNFYWYEGGTFSGTILYWSLECKNREDCEAALDFLTHLDHRGFSPWKPSRYGVVMYGPGFYDEALRTDLWDVRGIKNGGVYEEVIGDHRSMYYAAIDYDSNRVYYHYESGGFPPDARPRRP